MSEHMQHCISSGAYTTGLENASLDNHLAFDTSYADYTFHYYNSVRNKLNLNL